MVCFITEQFPTIQLCVASPTRIRTVPVVGVPHHLEVELNGLGEDCVMSIWRAKCPSVANPTRIRTVPVVGVPHHLEVELNGLGEDCVISIWRAKCPSVASPTRIRIVPVVGVPHHLEVELNGLGEDCVEMIQHFPISSFIDKPDNFTMSKTNT
ncbi:hypothetical protein ACJJTC_014354 [Scirpophaga incertulas]